MREFIMLSMKHFVTDNRALTLIFHQSLQLTCHNCYWDNWWLLVLSHVSHNDCWNCPEKLTAKKIILFDFDWIEDLFLCQLLRMENHYITLQRSKYFLIAIINMNYIRSMKRQIFSLLNVLKIHFFKYTFSNIYTFT